MVIILEEREEEAVGVDIFFKGNCLYPYGEDGYCVLTAHKKVFFSPLSWLFDYYFVPVI